MLASLWMLLAAFAIILSPRNRATSLFEKKYTIQCIDSNDWFDTIDRIWGALYLRVLYCIGFGLEKNKGGIPCPGRTSSLAL